MGKPILDIGVSTLDNRSARVHAVIDTGSHATLVREDALPEGAIFTKYPAPQAVRTAARGGKLHIVGGMVLVMTIGDRMVRDEALVSSDLAQQMIVGAGTMQKWDITIRNKNGKTKVVVGKDMRDPDIQEVD